MNLEREQRARTIFETASQLPETERAAFLDRECGGDELLRRAAEDLLRFSPTKVTIAMDPPPSGGPRYAPAECIGDYEIVQALGEGGFGIVYLATQREPVTRKVAVKVMRSVRQGDAFIRAFEAERQTLAKMSHPGIAHFYDAGITEYDQPYFVMEYVPGIPITRFCDEHRLDIRQRLALMAEVCRAVQHAHTKQVIHRDLTPNNILVSMDEDGTPRPRIIDFGIAMGVDEDSSRIMGTPSYMSPEQATSDLDVDTRSDIYTLGAVLYELLVSQPPLTQEMLRSAEQQAVFRLVREVEIPDPSTRLSDVLDPGMAEARQVSQSELRRMLRRELDWIPRKAMEKNPENRYATASDLAADIDDFLDGRPITAAGQRRGYRFRKTLQRHKFAFVASLLVLLSLVGGVVATSLLAAYATRSEVEATSERMRAEDNERRAKEQEAIAQQQKAIAEARAAEARKQKAKAETRAAEAEELKQSLQEIIEETEDLNDELTEATAKAEEARKEAELGLLRNQSQLRQIEQLKIEAEDATKSLKAQNEQLSAFSQFASGLIIDNKGSFGTWLRGDVANRLEQDTLQPIDRGRIQMALGLAFEEAGDTANATEYFKGAEESFVEAGLDDTSPERIAVKDFLHMEALKNPVDLNAYKFLVDMFPQELQPSIGELFDAVALAYRQLSPAEQQALNEAGELLMAGMTLDDAFEARNARLGGFMKTGEMSLMDFNSGWLKGFKSFALDAAALLLPRMDIKSLSDDTVKLLLSILIAADAQDMAIDVATRAGAINTENTNLLIRIIKANKTDQLKHDEAAAAYRQWLAASSATQGEEADFSIRLALELAQSLDIQKQYDDAEALYRTWLPISSEVLGDDHDTTSGLSMWLVDNLRNQKKYKQMETVARERLEASITGLGEEDRITIWLGYMLGRSLDSQKRYDEAVEVYRTWLLISSEALGDDHKTTSNLSMWLVGCLSRAKQYEQMEAVTRERLEASRAARGEQDASTIWLGYWLGRSLFQLERYDDAEAVFQTWLPRSIGSLGSNHRTTDELAMWLLSCLGPTGKSSEMETLARERLADRIEVHGEDDPNTIWYGDYLGKALALQENFDEAEAVHLHWLERCESTPNTDAQSQRITKQLADLYDAWGKPELAQQYRDRLPAEQPTP